jgi:hypothetical protein
MKHNRRRPNDDRKWCRPRDSKAQGVASGRSFDGDIRIFATVDTHPNGAQTALPIFWYSARQRRRLSLRSASLRSVAPIWQQLGTICYIAALPRHWLLMEDSMCWEIDYKFFAEQKKAQEIKQERRAGLIDRLLNEANRQGEKTAEETPAKEAAPAK